MKTLAAVLSVLLMIQAAVAYAENDFPTHYASVSVDASDSYDVAKECMPSLSESSFNRSIRDAGEKSVVAMWPNEKSASVLVINKGRILCIKRSEQGHLVLPLGVFDNTIDFDEMAKDTNQRMRTDLAKQLAKLGVASALVINDNGNAYYISYMFNSNRPSRLYYHAGFLKKGDFDESSFSSVYRSSGGMSLSSRGQPAENYVPIFR